MAGYFENNLRNFVGFIGFCLIEWIIAKLNNLVLEVDILYGNACEFLPGQVEGIGFENIFLDAPLVGKTKAAGSYFFSQNTPEPAAAQYFYPHHLSSRADGDAVGEGSTGIN